jgi:hypothetical protein
MPPRFTYWTIIFGGQPTAFRSGTRDELLPTFKQIQAKHPDAQLRYFARGKLWYSEEEAQAALIRERFERKGHEGRRRHEGERRPEGERRDRNWRPGGEHKDPRDRFKVPRDVRRARFKANQHFRGPRPEGREPDARDRPPRPEGWKPRPDHREPGTGGWKPKPAGWKPRPDSRKPGPGGGKPKPAGWKPRPGGRRPGPPFRKKKDEE